MTRQISYRTADLEHSEGRTVYGLAVPFDQLTDINDYDGSTFREKFVRGSFARTIRERGHKVRLLSQHRHREMPIGKASLLREESRGLYAEFDIAKTQAGDEALELVRTGCIDAFSIGFEAIRQDWDDDGRTRTCTRTEVALHEVSLVNFPAYETAIVGGVRSHGLVIPSSAAAARLRLLDL